MNRLSGNFSRQFLVTVLICWAGSLLLASSLAYACSCGNSPALNSQIQDKKAIFLIEVIDEEIDFPYRGELSPDWIKRYPYNEEKLKRQTATVKVLKIWKGKLYKTLTYSAIRNGTCTFFLQPGKKYLFYGAQKDHHITTSVCNRTSSLENKEVEIGYLDRAMRGDSPQQLQEYLLGVLESDQEEGIREQAFQLLWMEWGGYHRDAKNTQSAQRAWEAVSRDPTPEIRKHSLELMLHLYFTKEEKHQWAVKQLNDESALVRQQAAQHLRWSMDSKEKTLEEIKSFAVSILDQESKMPLPRDPDELKAQREMIQDILSLVIKHNGNEAQPWMIAYILEDIDSEFQKVRFSAHYHLTRLRNLNALQKEKVLAAFVPLVTKLIQGRTLPKVSSDYWIRNTEGHFNKVRITQYLNYWAGYLFDEGGDQYQKELLPEILKGLRTENIHLRNSLLEILREIDPENNNHRNQIRTFFQSEIEKLTQQAAGDREQWHFRRGTVERLIGYLIDREGPDYAKRFLPDMLADLTNDFKGVSEPAFNNLKKLKSHGTDLMKELERIYQNANPRSKPRLRRWIDQLKRKAQ